MRILTLSAGWCGGLGGMIGKNLGGLTARKISIWGGGVGGGAELR